MVSDRAVNKIVRQIEKGCRWKEKVYSRLRKDEQETQMKVWDGGILRLRDEIDVGCVCFLSYENS